MRSFAVNAFVAVVFGLQIASAVAAPVNGTDTSDSAVAAQEANLPPNQSRTGICGSPAFNPFIKGPKSDIAIVGKNGKQINLGDLCKGFPIPSSSVIATAAPTASIGGGDGQCATVTVTVTATGGTADPTQATTIDPLSPISLPTPIISSPLSLPTNHRILPIIDSA